MIKEACVETYEEALNAELLGADRIELCSDLHLDGLTPSFELMQLSCSSLKIPVMVMIRPRSGNFIYSEKEIFQMKEEIGQAKNAGATGVVFGVLTEKNKIDIPNTKLLAEYAFPLQVTFHKAIDVLDDPIEGVNELLKIKGITRILTSGGKATAKEGIDTIIKMKEASSGVITILVAGKVTNNNIKEIRNLSGATEFHGRKIV